MKNQLDHAPHRARPAFSLHDIAVRVRDRWILSGLTMDIDEGQHWAVLGPNGSGKSTLLRAILGHAPVVRGTVSRRSPRFAGGRIGHVSFELHERLIAADRGRDEARYFSGRWKDFTTAGQTILGADDDPPPDPAALDWAVETLEIGHLMDRGIRTLSTGEMRKILIARAMVMADGVLILDEPFDGLDVRSRESLAGTIRRLMDAGVQIILAANRLEEVPPDVTHVLCLKNERVFCQGERAEVMTPSRMAALFDQETPPPAGAAQAGGAAGAPSPPGAPPLVRIKNTTVKYGPVTALNQVSLTFRQGENWAVIGPNGAGKSTLLSLITADHPQAYSNDVRLFGRRRGSGESVWDVKTRIGQVSSEFQVRYQKRLGMFDVVLSGFFDSVGLYRIASPEQKEAARRWIIRLGLEEKAERMFDQLSFGERRMTLLARAMVKSPELLVLDEPCQGLDRTNRAIILDAIERIGARTPTHLLYVTHHEEETPPCITHILRLGGSRV
ncbi:MAG: ATP-binding cassette domain-containing protein [Desulfobacterales bacterium]|nr:ATP-binding cassette domain-containing protein [Desulfobacterales bacterium]